MPCFRCGARQTDPVRGASPWKRGVRAERQVLICPRCQAAHEGTADLDRCVACGSVALGCRLGEIECRDCGHVREAVRDDDIEPDAGPGTARDAGHAAGRDTGRDAGRGKGGDLVPSGARPPSDTGLSEEVAAALSRFFGRSPGS